MNLGGPLVVGAASGVAGAVGFRAHPVIGGAAAGAVAALLTGHRVMPIVMVGAVAALVVDRLIGRIEGAADGAARSEVRSQVDAKTRTISEKVNATAAQVYNQLPSGVRDLVDQIGARF